MSCQNVLTIEKNMTTLNCDYKEKKLLFKDSNKEPFRSAFY